MVPRTLRLTSLLVLLVGVAGTSAQAAEVSVINRTSVTCTIEAQDLSIAVEPSSTVMATIADDLGDQLEAVCDGSGLDKDVATCELLIGGTGGSGQTKDEVYEFKYVKEIHVFVQVGRFLVCSSI